VLALRPVAAAPSNAAERSGAAMDKALTWFMRVWIVIGIALNIVGAGLVMTDGVWKTLEIFRPFTLANVAAEVIVFSPVFLAYCWRGQRRVKAAPARAATAATVQGDRRVAGREDQFERAIGDMLSLDRTRQGSQHRG
jgi:hypothetical protein